MTPLALSGTAVPDVSAQKLRDLNLFRIGGTVLSFAVDSSGSVGWLADDRFPCPPHRSGGFMVKVVLTETLCAGFDPVAVYLDVCYAPPPQFDAFLAGIRDELRSAHVSPDLLFASCGDHPEPRTSACGITVVGALRPGHLRPGRSRPGDLVYAVGLPFEKDEPLRNTTTEEIVRILSLPYVHEVLPCGSHGIRYEAESLAATSGLRFHEVKGTALTDQALHSCGASAVVLVTMAPEHGPSFQQLDIPRAIGLFGSLSGSAPPTDGHEEAGPPEVSLAPNGDILVEGRWVLSSETAFSYAWGQQPADRPGRADELAVGAMARALEALRAGGCDPILVVDDLNFPMERHGRECIQAAGRFLRETYGLDPATQFTGSTEDNFQALHSGIAIRAFGVRSSSLPARR